MQAAVLAPPLHPNPRGRVSNRLSLPGLRLPEFRQRQMFCLPGEFLERLNPLPLRVRPEIRRKILP